MNSFGSCLLKNFSKFLRQNLTLFPQFKRDRFIGILLIISVTSIIHKYVHTFYTIYVKSTQYKKLALCGSHIKIWNLPTALFLKKHLHAWIYLHILIFIIYTNSLARIHFQTNYLSMYLHCIHFQLPNFPLGRTLHNYIRPG